MAKTLQIVAVILVTAASLLGQNAGRKPRIGSYDVLFNRPNPLSDLKKQQKRLGWTDKLIRSVDPDQGYDLRKELFFVHVPANYDPSKPPGLFVWVAPGDDGRPAQDWPEVLKQNNLIFVGAHKSGNERFVWYRIALALDAVHNMKERYKIDEERIYVGGFSGGGRLASTLGLHWADVFRGGIYAGGTNHFRSLPRPSGGLKWRAKIKKPKGKLLKWARTRSRHAFVNGEDDFNREHSKAVAKDLRSRQSFKHAAYLEMKGLAHNYPDAKNLHRAIRLLDVPLEKAKQAAAEKAARKARRAAQKKTESRPSSRPSSSNQSSSRL